MTVDLSRLLTDPRKHYAGVRAQQGRVLTDDDLNESSILAEEELRRTRVVTIGAYGSPDQGFLPKNFAVDPGGNLDFTLSRGELYLGGLRLEMSTEEQFLEQKDWLDFDSTVDAATPPAAGSTRVDLAWIEAWQQPVTAIEDSELMEVALGGPDAGTRWRTMRRVHLTADATGDTCAEAWAPVSATLGTPTPEAELATTATLTVTFTAPSVPGDLCSPPQAGGYLGAENQAIRVQMVDSSHYCWGYDNGSPLYRVKVRMVGGQPVGLTFLTEPRDATLWPLAGQTVELLAWSAALANGERTAELSGHLCKIARSYDTSDQTAEIDVALPAGFDLWKARSDKADFFDGTPEEDFLYLRVWNRGDDLASPAAIPVATTNLGNSGLAVSFAGGPLRASDHWIIAARPAAPDVVTPWRLQLPSGAPPNGVRRFAMPLGLISWTADGAGNVTGTLIDDCRPPFHPLTQQRGCCSVTVGDGVTSFGVFSSIQAAVDSLPASGGTVCVHPGVYHEAIVIAGRKNITIHGCGPRSRIIAHKADGEASTAIWIVKSSDVLIERLALEGGKEAVVRIQESRAVRVSDCLVQFRDRRDFASVWPAIYVHGMAVEIEDNIIEPLPDDLDRIMHKLAEAQRGLNATAARGGIQLAGGCHWIRLAGNVIVGGTGNGITLGSIRIYDPNDPKGQPSPDVDNDDPCVPCDPNDGGPPPEDGGTRYLPDGDLYDIEIVDNMILRHGANGIAAVRFFATGKTTSVALVSVHGLRIADNVIQGCLRRAIAQATTAMMLLLGYGGISLAYVTDLTVEANVIADNGRDWLSPVCGIFALVAARLRIEHNLIRNNGPRNGEPPERAQPGVRAGIHIWLALALPDDAAKSEIMSARSKVMAPRPSIGNSDQLRIHGNLVQQPLGRALFMAGAGPMAVTDNRLLSEGTAERVTDKLALTALVANFGISKEWTAGMLVALVEKLLHGADPAYASKICDILSKGQNMPGIWPRLPTGKLMFNDNQVSFLMRDAARGFDFSSALLLSLDDVGACDNQFELHTENRKTLCDLLALGMTVRSDDNRLAETWGRTQYSIFSSALLNTAMSNQSTHCLHVTGFKTVPGFLATNLVLADALCDNFCARDRKMLDRIKAVASRAFTLHG